MLSSFDAEFIKSIKQSVVFSFKKKGVDFEEECIIQTVSYDKDSRKFLCVDDWGGDALLEWNEFIDMLNIYEVERLMEVRFIKNENNLSYNNPKKEDDEDEYYVNVSTNKKIKRTKQSELSYEFHPEAGICGIKGSGELKRALGSPVKEIKMVKINNDWSKMK